jgi:hypothetical protein
MAACRRRDEQVSAKKKEEVDRRSVNLFITTA